MIFDCANPFEVGRMELRRMIRAADGSALAEGEAAPADAQTVAVLRGYAAKFNVRSEMMFGFAETIAPRAFDAVLGDDCRALFNHDPNMLLGRTLSGTCRIEQDDTGLIYEVDLPDTDYAENVATMVARGDLSQSSFAFRVARENGDHWEEMPDGTWLRTILKLERLYDVSPVTYPAYPDATVGMRSALVAGQKERREATQRLHAADRRSIAAQHRARRLKLIGA
jgi:HK97 family phage prohead protease